MPPQKSRVLKKFYHPLPKFRVYFWYNKGHKNLGGFRTKKGKILGEGFTFEILKNFQTWLGKKTQTKFSVNKTTTITTYQGTLCCINQLKKELTILRHSLSFLNCALLTTSPHTCAHTTIDSFLLLHALTKTLYSVHETSFFPSDVRTHDYFFLLFPHPLSFFLHARCRVCERTQPSSFLFCASIARVL